MVDEMKELPYFRFYTGEWLTKDVTLLSMRHQGLFINVCAHYWNNGGEITFKNLTRRYPGEIDLLNDLIEEGIIDIGKDDNISINFLNEQMTKLLNTHKKLVKAGRRGGLSQAQARLKPGLSIKDKDKDKDKIDGDRMPSFDDFKKYALEKKSNVNIQELKFKYDSWVENGWKDGNDNKIKNWKSKLLNTLPHLGEVTITNRKQTTILASDGREYGVFK